MKILLLGGSSFIGKNIYLKLKDKYNITAPTHNELDLLDLNKLQKYLKDNRFTLIINAAMYNEDFNHPFMLEKSLRMFHNLKICNEYYDRMLYFGSGAEYNKALDISLIKEEDFGRSLPENNYGLAKYLMQESLKKEDRITNLRLFAVYGPYEDYKSKFISYNLLSFINNENLTIRQNCIFDYMYIDDLIKIVEYFINNEGTYIDYNVCSGKRISLLEIAEIIRSLTDNNLDIIIDKTGYNKEYTGSNERLMSIDYFNDFKFIPIEEGIDKLYNWYISNN